MIGIAQIMLHLLGIKCLGDLGFFFFFNSYFSGTVRGISCLLAFYCPHLQLFVGFCVFSAAPPATPHLHVLPPALP